MSPETFRFFFQAEDGIRDHCVTGVQTCALPISLPQLSKNLGDLAYRASRYDEAWEAYRRAVELAPDLGDDVYFKLGNIAYKRNERELATQLWRQALEINPKHELVKANLDTLSEIGRAHV